MAALATEGGLQCSVCQQSLSASSFSRSQIKRIVERGLGGSCKVCAEQNVASSSGSARVGGSDKNTELTDHHFPAPSKGGAVVLTMHQPWASLLVYGVKRVEGRAWSTDFRGTLWIHAGGKRVEPEEIRRIETFYRDVIYKGVDVEFPKHYPYSHIVGCVEVTDCLDRSQFSMRFAKTDPRKHAELLCEKGLLCSNARRLLVPFGPMPGNGMLYTVSKKQKEAMLQAVSATGSYDTVGLPLPREEHDSVNRDGLVENVLPPHVGDGDSELARILALSVIEQ